MLPGLFLCVHLKLQSVSGAGYGGGDGAGGCTAVFSPNHSMSYGSAILY